MKKLVLTLAAIAAMSAPALAGDFAATLHYPQPASPSVQKQDMDQISTGSISRQAVSAEADRKVPARETAPVRKKR